MATSPTLLGSVEVRESTDIYPSPLPRQYSFLAKPPINQRINIRHPAYEPESDLLFTLYAWDHSKGGLQYGLVHNACAVVAANRRDGYLSKARDGGRIHASRTDILGAGDYFYHVPRAESENSDEKPNRYAIVPSFQDWKFPSSLPEEFNDPYNTESAFYTTQQSTMTAAVRTRDITCRITNHHTGTQVAHLCPGHEREWFLRNSMAMWNIDLTLDPDNLLDDLSNMILLRSDLHAAFDDHKFVLYPKADDGYVVHMLEPTLDIGQLYHNVKIHPLLQCNPRFLYARFAWALFPSLAGFLSKPGVSRCLLLARTSERGVEWVEEEVAKPEELRAKISASRSRSPKKRQRVTDVNPHEDAETDSLPEISPKRQCRSISMTADREKATSAGLEDSVLIHQPESTTRACEDELARMEWEEDMELQRRHIDLTSSAMPPSWYPGWRQIQRLKTKWITLGRPKDYPDWQPGAGIGRLSNEGVVGQVRGFYEAMGSDCTDDDDTI